jgi:hypothetical protein
MKNGKRQAQKPRPHKVKSRGTAWAAQTRAQCNSLTPAQREKLLDRALKLAYGAETRSVPANNARGEKLQECE